MFRLWIATYADWHPGSWNASPPRATALEPVENALCSADEAALFLEGFNGLMLEHDQPIWAVAVPVTVRYDGDAQPGALVKGHVFADQTWDATKRCGGEASATPTSPPVEPDSNDHSDHFQGFDQSPQRSR